MKISIITSVYNNKDSISESIESVLSQTYENIEYIIIDGGSTDGTMEIIQTYKDRISIVSSRSDDGIYDGLNRGIKIASGDIVGFIHSDDLYESQDTLKKVVALFENKQADIVYGDLVYVYRDNTSKIFRFWESGTYSYKKLKRGWMPPHPAFFVKKKLYEKYGLFDKNLKISADYDFMLRVLIKHEHKIFYLPEILYRMRIGGISNRSLSTVLQKSKEDLKVIRKNKIGGINTLMFKNFSKISQFFKKPK